MYEILAIHFQNFTFSTAPPSKIISKLAFSMFLSRKTELFWSKLVVPWYDFRQCLQHGSGTVPIMIKLTTFSHLYFIICNIYLENNDLFRYAGRHIGYSVWKNLFIFNQRVTNSLQKVCILSPAETCLKTRSQKCFRFHLGTINSDQKSSVLQERNMEKAKYEIILLGGAFLNVKFWKWIARISREKVQHSGKHG